MQALPVEVAETILAHLPVDRSLALVAGACRLFAAILGHDAGFAMRHARSALVAHRASASKLAATVAQQWRWLPRPYQTAVFALLIGRRDSLFDIGVCATPLALRMLHDLSEHPLLYGIGWRDLSHAFSWFCHGNHVEPTRRVLRYTSVSETQLKYGLMKAVTGGAVDVVKYALIERWVGSADLADTLAEAARYGKVEVVRVLMGSNLVETNAKNQALIEALRCNQVEVVRLLMMHDDTDPYYQEARPYLRVEGFMGEEVSRVLREM
ncbi:hypothetical protein BC830DRAFT_1087460, partial [Chytriomyces sp. MP71]